MVNVTLTAPVEKFGVALMVGGARDSVLTRMALE